jgi:hypothetical protein
MGMGALRPQGKRGCRAMSNGRLEGSGQSARPYCLQRLIMLELHMARIAISYRREDTAAITGRIFDRLKSHYERGGPHNHGENAVFMDYDSTPLGVDFRQFIRNVLDNCDVLLVVIGSRWAEANDGFGQRIMRDSDWVRIEIETALKKGIPIIPILIDRTPLPSPDKLPDTIRDLAYRQAAIIDSQIDFNQHVDRLLRQLDRLLGFAAHPGTSSSSEVVQSSGQEEPLTSRGKPGAGANPRRALAYLLSGVLICAAGISAYFYIGQSGKEPSYESYKSDELGLAIIFPIDVLSLDTTQRQQRVLFLRNSHGAALVKISRTASTFSGDVRVERQKEVDDLRRMNFTLTYIAPEKEENWSNWYVISGVRIGSVFYYRRWYKPESVVSMEFDYPKEQALLFNKVIPRMTRELTVYDIVPATGR